MTEPKVHITKSFDELEALNKKYEKEGYKLACVSNTGLPFGQVRVTFLTLDCFNEKKTLPLDVELKSLKGKHILTSVDMDTKKDDDGDDCDRVMFTLDDVVYAAIEDASDGYRSNLESFQIVNEFPTNVFDGVEVVCMWLTDGSHGGDDCEILEIVNATTGDVILRVGVDNVDDYYPRFVCNFSAEAIGEVKLEDMTDD